MYVYVRVCVYVCTSHRQNNCVNVKGGAFVAAAVKMFGKIVRHETSASCTLVTYLALDFLFQQDLKNIALSSFCNLVSWKVC